MNNKKTLVYYILLNILISALTTLSVLWIWDHIQLSPGKNPPSASPVLPSETAPVPSIDQTVIKIDNVFGLADLENEVVVLKRLGEGDLWLTGWQMKDTHAHVYTFPQLLLNKDGAVQVYTRTGSDTAITLYWGLPQAVWNSGDTVVLYDPPGKPEGKLQDPLRTMFNKIVEDKIHEAMLAGVFDNLPGNGKPLNLDQNPFEAEDWHAVNNLLRQNNFTYPWMEKADEILTLTDKLSQSPCEEWSLVKTSGEKERFAAEYSKKNRTLNHEILDYNLQVPSQVFQKPVFDPDLELKKITG